MARNRKPKIPLERPPEIPEDEAWRLINQSGVLAQPIPTAPVLGAPEEEERIPLAEEVFNCVVLAIPFSSLLIVMDILIHLQYARHSTVWEVVERVGPSVPILGLFIFYTTRYKHDRRMQSALFLLSCAVGPRLIWLINRGSWLVNMRQCPPVATIWVLTVVQLDLGKAVLSLVVIGIWAWWKGMKLVP